MASAPIAWRNTIRQKYSEADGIVEIGTLAGNVTWLYLMTDVSF